MITTKEEAHAHALKFGVNPKKEKQVYVTENGNIYLSENIDPNDIGKKVFDLTGEETPEDVQLAAEIAAEEAEKKAAAEKAEADKVAQEEADKLAAESATATDKKDK